jgi:hypothetical protein
VTYPEAEVAATITERFVPCQVNVQAEEAKSLLQRFHQAWTPDIRLLALDRSELYAWQGYLPPFEFLAQLLAGEGNARLRLAELSSAAAVYEELLRRFPTSAVAPEAQYYLAVARYKATHDAPDLTGGWQRLQSRYPTSIWRQKQVFIEPE